MIQIIPGMQIDDDELSFDFVRASGPGGQNVNKVATAVQLRFNLGASSLPQDVKNRLRRLAGRRIIGDDVILIDSGRFRTQGRNRQDAIEKLIELIRKAALKPKKRTKTRPSKAAREERLKSKKMRGETKKLRQGAID